MPTFVFNNSAASNSGVILLEVPDLAWFNDSVLSALAEMTLPDNWRGDDEDYRKYALLQANLMMATYKVLNFNPFPVGMVIAWTNLAIPPGYLLCDGSTYLNTQYPELSAAIDEYYHGDDTTFDVPDLLGYAIYGTSVDMSFPNDFGGGGGEREVTLFPDQLAQHVHYVPPPMVIDPGHSHLESVAAPTAITIGAGVPAPSALPSAGLTSTAFTGISIDAQNTDVAGGDLPHNNMPPYQNLVYIIYAGR